MQWCTYILLYCTILLWYVQVLVHSSTCRVQVYTYICSTYLVYRCNKIPVFLLLSPHGYTLPNSTPMIHILPIAKYVVISGHTAASPNTIVIYHFLLVLNPLPFNRILIFHNEPSSEFFFFFFELSYIWRNHPKCLVAALVVDHRTCIRTVIYIVRYKFSFLNVAYSYVHTCRVNVMWFVFVNVWSCCSILIDFNRLIPAQLGWPRPVVRLNFPTNGIHPYFRRVGFRNAWATICDRWNPRKLKFVICTCKCLLCMYMYKMSKKREKKKEKKRRFGGERELIRLSWYKRVLKNWFDR